MDRIQKTRARRASMHDESHANDRRGPIPDLWVVQLDEPWDRVLDDVPADVAEQWRDAGFQTIRDLCVEALAWRQRWPGGGQHLRPGSGSQWRRLVPWVFLLGVRRDGSVTGDWVDEPVERLFADVSVRAANALLNAGAQTLGQAWIMVGSARLLWLPNVGRKTLCELRRALSLFVREGAEVARWGLDGRPHSVTALAGRILASMKPRDRMVINGIVIDGRTQTEVAVDLGVCVGRVGQIAARAIRTANQRFGDVAAELVGPALDELERMGGAATGWDVGDLTGEASTGAVALALRVSGEGRYRVAEGCLTRLTLPETRRLVPPNARR